MMRRMMTMIIALMIIFRNFYWIWWLFRCDRHLNASECWVSPGVIFNTTSPSVCLPHPFIETNKKNPFRIRQLIVMVLHDQSMNVCLSFCIREFECPSFYMSVRPSIRLSEQRKSCAATAKTPRMDRIHLAAHHHHHQFFSRDSCLNHCVTPKI